MAHRAHGVTPSAAAVLMLALTVSLGGCAAGRAPAASSTATPSPSPDTATEPISDPGDPLESVTTVVARGDALELRDASGAVVDRFEYTDAPADAIEALTVVFDREPEEVQRDAVSHHTPPRILHTWEALTVDERLYSEEIREKQEASGLMMPDFIVSFGGPETDGIRLTTEPGISAGDGLEAIDDLPSPAEPTCVGPAVDPVDARNAENTDMRVGVVLSDVIVDEAAHTATQVEYIAAVIAPVVVGPGCV